VSVTDLVLDGAKALASAMLTREDSWANALTGLGSLRDKLTHNQIGPSQVLPDATLENLYNGDHLAAKICEAIPKDATRRGYAIELEGMAPNESARTARDIVQHARQLKALPSLRQAWIWGRLYGGGAVFIGADDGQTMEQPLNEQNIRRIRSLTVAMKPQLTVRSRYQDEEHPRHGEVETYEVRRAPAVGMMTPIRTGTVIHESRLIVFGGTLGARFFNVNPGGFEDSVLQRVHTVLRDTATSWQSTAHLLTDASQGVLKIKNLMGLIASSGKEVLRTRVELIDMARSVCRSLLIDEGESFERLATSFAGIPELMDRFMMNVASAAEMPVTKLYGRSPAGMNATGESDTRGWYDTVEDAQSDVLLSRHERLLTVCMLAKDSPTKGKLPESWRIKYLPLWQPTAAEEANRKKTVAETHVALVNAQIMLEVEASLGLAGDFPSINVEMRQKILADELKAREERAGEPPPDPKKLGTGDDDPDDDPDDEPDDNEA
jgi:uncharacterized protein